ncbi:FAD:protein FMN transferase, partial [Candidatus Woesearchaeota archaeon]|nr:FAD:protein FMN transferase [Candidatus Woesearchaeota archaeon]
KENEYLAIIKLNDKSVATSGDYERYFEPDKKFHHIVDPRTGYSATELISVTIVTDTALDADALATSVFVLGPEKGLELIESLENVEGLLITKDREIIKSSGFEY